MIFHSRKFSSLVIVLLMTLLLVACTPEAEEGQEVEITPPADTSQSDDDNEEDDDAASIEFTGIISSIEGSVIVVNGLQVDTSNANLTGSLEEGVTVRIEGELQPNATVIAVMIVVVLSPEATPEASPEATVPAETTPNPEATEMPDDDDDDIIIVIEGPVSAININIITIYGIDIQLSPDDPLLTVIQIGDIIRVEGDFDESSPTIIIIAVTIIFIDIDVFVLDGEVWRDSGNCLNPPPPWAPANGWRRRCEGGGGGSGGGRGSGRGSRRSS